MTDSEDSPSFNNNDKVYKDTNSVSTTDNATDTKSSEDLESFENNDDKNIKRDNLETSFEDELTKRQKLEHSTETSFLDIIKSVVKEGGQIDDNFNVLTNTKEYDCPIAKLAKMNDGKGFFNFEKTEEDKKTTEIVEEGENNEEDEKEIAHEVFVEPSVSENEKLLQEIKECKLSVYKNSEWSMPVPVVTHLILNNETSHKRVVCFQVGTGRLLLNTVLLPSMSFNKLKNKSIIFNGQPLGENSSLVPHRLVFTDTTVRDEFHDLYSK